jgi:Ca2+-dependent lipid-binding protein
LRNTEIFGKMDPFVTVEYKGVRKSTQVCKNGGKHPMWGHGGSGELVEFKINQMADEIDFFCYDEDIVSNDLIGS